MSACLQEIRKNDAVHGTVEPVELNCVENSGHYCLNVVFVAVNAAESSYQLTDDMTETLAKTFVNAGQGGRGFDQFSPFQEWKPLFNYWIYKPFNQKPLLKNWDKNDMCSASSGGAITAMNHQMEYDLKGFGMKNAYIANLISRPCRSQSGSIDLGSIAELQAASRGTALATARDGSQAVAKDIAKHPTNFLSDLKWNPGGQFAFDELKDRLLSLLAGRLVRRFDMPRSYLSIPEQVARGERPIAPEEIATAAHHEPGHWEGLIDLYAERNVGDVPHLEDFLNGLDRTYDLLDLFGLNAAIVEFSAVHFYFSPNLLSFQVNLLQELMRLPQMTDLLGIPLGFPHCAVTEEEGRGWIRWLKAAWKELDRAASIPPERSWARRLDEVREEDYFGPAEGGCLYVKSHFRAGNGHSVMRVSGSPDAELSAVEQAWLAFRFACRTLPNPPDVCRKKPG